MEGCIKGCFGSHLESKGECYGCGSREACARHTRAIAGLGATLAELAEGDSGLLRSLSRIEHGMEERRRYGQAQERACQGAAGA